MSRRVPAIVIALSALIAMTAAVLAGNLLTVSDAPFRAAFTAHNGAHLAAAGTNLPANPPGVAESDGPYPLALVTALSPEGFTIPMAISGRGEGGDIDSLTLVEGRWPSADGEIAMSGVPGESPPPGFTFTIAGKTVTIVGVVYSVTDTASAWATPSQAAAWANGRGQMLYRLTDPNGVDAVKAALGTIDAAVSWLDVKTAAERDTALYLPFLSAFGILGLVMSALVVGNVVAGAVGSGRRRVGILKALGFTPAQVVRGFMARALIPAAIGTVLGGVLGNLGAVPLLGAAGDAYRTDPPGPNPLVTVTAAITLPLVVAVVAWASAARAGRLRTVEALAPVRATGRARGRRSATLAARSPLPRSISLGLARPFARPGRAAAMILAVALGAAAVTFAVGLSASLAEIGAARSHGLDVTVEAGKDPAAIENALTGHEFYGSRTIEAMAAGHNVELTGFTRDATIAGYRMISGRWFTAPGEAVAASAFLTATGTRVGDRVTVRAGDREVVLTVVGEVFDTRADGMRLHTSAESMGVTPERFFVSGATDTEIQALVAPLGGRAEPSGDSAGQMIGALNAIAAAFTLLLVAVAGLGVVNGVVLDVRDRARDLGVQKALGMTPRQTIAGVVASIAPAGLVGALLGVPAGIALHQYVVPAMGSGAGTKLPVVALEVFGPGLIAAVALAGPVIAVLGALPPASWAAGVRTATSLRSE